MVPKNRLGPGGSRKESQKEAWDIWGRVGWGNVPDKRNSK